MVEIGFLLAVASSFLQAFKEIAIKHNLKGIDSNTMIFLLSGLSVLFWFPFVIYEGIPDLSLKFWGIFFLSGILFYIGKLFSFKAFQVGDISYIAPLKGMIGVGVIILGAIILHEYPSLLGFLGIFSVLFGTYLLNLQKYHSRFIDPILFFWRDPGARLYLVTIVCYSFTNIFDKIGVTETSPVFWIFMMNVFLLVMSLKDMKQSYVQDMQVVKKKYLSFGSTFAFYAGSHITQMFAIQYLFVSYLSAIKIASMLLVIIFGGLFFKEQGVLKKAMVGTIIVFGVILIYFA